MNKSYIILSIMAILTLMLITTPQTRAVTVSGNSTIYSFNVTCNSSPPTTGCSADTLVYTCQIDNAAYINYVELKIGGVFYNATQSVNQFSFNYPKPAQNSSINTTITLSQERIHDNNNGFINAFVNATVTNDCSICTPTSVVLQACNSTNEAIVNLTYAPTGCNNDTIQIQACTYCTPTWIPRTGGIYDCNQNGTKLQYYDDFSTCCILSPINCFTPIDHNTIISCGYYPTDMTCQYDNNPYLTSKINFACTLPGTHATSTVDCITYVRKANQTLLIQSSPEYADAPALAFWKESEKRTSFSNTGNIINAYYTDKALETGQEFILGMKCTTPTGVLTSEYPITPTYQPPTSFINRAVWAGDNLGYIIIWILGIILLIIAFAWGLKKLRGHK
jgi:hypothetical protein